MINFTNRQIITYGRRPILWEGPSKDNGQNLTIAGGTLKEERQLLKVTGQQTALELNVTSISDTPGVGVLRTMV